MRILSIEGKGTSLPLDSIVSTDAQQPTTSVRDELTKKHPPGQPAHPSTLIHPSEEVPDVHPVLFECIDGTAIRSAAIRTNSSAGPSGLDTVGWNRLVYIPPTPIC